jgi:Chaperone of endosialidase
MLERILERSNNMIRNNIRNLVIGFAVGSLGLALAVAIPNTFTNGTVISSGAVNENFAALTTATTALEGKTNGFGRIGELTGFNDTVLFNNEALFGKKVNITTSTAGPLLLSYSGASGFANPELNIKRYGADFGRVRFSHPSDPLKFWDIAANNTEFRVYARQIATDVLVINDGTSSSIPPRVSINGELNVTGTVFANVTPLSDKNVKTSFSQIDSRDVLKKVSKMAVSSWRYKTEPQNMRHIGVMAQDFYKQFGLGADNKHINTVDADGVMVASIQALNSLVIEKDAKIQSLEKRVSQLESLEARLAKLEAARR